MDVQALFQTGTQTYGDDNGAAQLNSLRGTPSFFRLVQVQPVRGRLFTDAEGEPGQDQKVLLSYGLWQRAFGGADTIVGTHDSIERSAPRSRGRAAAGLHVPAERSRRLPAGGVPAAGEVRQRAPQQQLADGRPAQGRRDARSGAPAGRRAERAERRTIPAVPSDSQGRPLPDDRRDAAGRRRARRQGVAVPALGRRVLRAAHRRRQHRQPDPRPIERPPARARDASRHWRRPGTPGPSARHRDDGALDHRWRVRRADRLVDSPVDGDAQSHDAAARLRDRPGLDRRRLHRVDHARGRRLSRSRRPHLRLRR